MALSIPPLGGGPEQPSADGTDTGLFQALTLIRALLEIFALIVWLNWAVQSLPMVV